MHRGFSVALLMTGLAALSSRAPAQTPNDAEAGSRTPPDAAAPPVNEPARSPTPPAPRPEAPKAPPRTELEDDAPEAPSSRPPPPDAPPPQPGDELAPSTEALPPTEEQSAEAPAAGISLLPQPTADARALRDQGERARADERSAEPKEGETQVFAEEWWTHARPVFELHGYFRLRAELFHNFSLGRFDSPDSALWPRPADDSYLSTGTQEAGPSNLCTSDEAGTGSNDDPSNLRRCNNKSNAGANIRFRLNPELHISDNLRVLSQIDILDNQTLGSTPSGASFAPRNQGGYGALPRSGYAPVGVFDDTIVPPSSGVNSLEDSIRVKRAWGEYTTPVGELRFGRMPNHWGLGMVYNAGDGYDDDYQSTIDRIQFVTGLKPLDLYLAGAWDFPNEGPVSQTLPGGVAHDLAQLDDVNQWALILMHQKSPELVKMALSKGQLLVEGGAYVTLRKQLLANDQPAADGDNTPSSTNLELSRGFSRRGAEIWLPDLWLRLRYKKFRFEAEWAAVLGSIENINTTANVPQPLLERDLRQFGLTTQIEQKLVEDRLRLNFGFGWASGDPDVYDPDAVGNLVPTPNQVQVNDSTDSTFRFHPNYRVDLILHRYILGRVQGTYYFRPAVEYDFMRKASGQRFGGGAHIVWSRASQLVQTPGHARDLGIELSGKLYFQSKDGALNDDPSIMGGFYAMLQYGVLFPLAGLGYQNNEPSIDTSAAQMLRMYLGILF